MNYEIGDYVRIWNTDYLIDKSYIGKCGIVCGTVTQGGLFIQFQNDNVHECVFLFEYCVEKISCLFDITWR